MKGPIKFQIGKNGVTPGVIESLERGFKTHKTIRISLLKGFSRDREEKIKVAEELASRMKGNFKYSIIGFTIVMRKIGEKKK